VKSMESWIEGAANRSAGARLGRLASGSRGRGSEFPL
jgi:hypothetical protein